MRLFSRLFSVCRFTALITLSVISLQPLCGTAHAQDDLLGPRFEAGAGLNGYSMDGNSPWMSDLYGTVMINGAIRIFKGLAIQGGIEYGHGNEVDTIWMDYDDDTKIYTNRGTFIESQWYGLRYEVPAPANRLGIDIIHASFGLVDGDFGIRSSKEQTDGEMTASKGAVSYKTATLSGHYASVAARWKMNLSRDQAAESWLDTFGVDLGVRYSQFSDCDLEHQQLTDITSDVAGIQLFITAFFKLDILY